MQREEMIDEDYSFQRGPTPPILWTKVQFCDSQLSRPDPSRRQQLRCHVSIASSSSAATRYQFHDVGAHKRKHSHTVQPSFHDGVTNVRKSGGRGMRLASSRNRPFIRSWVQICHQSPSRPVTSRLLFSLFCSNPNPSQRNSPRFALLLRTSVGGGRPSAPIPARVFFRGAALPILELLECRITGYSARITGTTIQL